MGSQPYDQVVRRLHWHISNEYAEHGSWGREECEELKQD